MKIKDHRSKEQEEDANNSTVPITHPASPTTQTRITERQIFYSGIFQPHIYYPTEGGGQWGRGGCCSCCSLVELAAGLGATAQHNRRVHGTSNVHDLEGEWSECAAKIKDQSITTVRYMQP